MKVEIQIDGQLTAPRVVIHAPKLTTELATLVEQIEGTKAETFLLSAKKDEKSYVIEPDQIEIIRTEGGITTIYNRKGQSFSTARPLHELENQLGRDFIRISKSSIVHIRHVDHLSRYFNGTMYIVMKNGVNDTISRSFLASFKKRLGL